MAKIAGEIDWLKTLEALVTAYEEIAAVRMQKIRNRVLENRDFLAGLNEIFTEVKFSYKRALVKYRLFQLKLKNGKKALVFVSANTGLYGDLIGRIFHELTGNLGSDKSEIVIIGQLGRHLFEEAYPKTPFTFFDLPDTFTDTSQTEKIKSFLLQFEEVVVYHGVFKNLVTQNIARTNITGGEETVSPASPLKTIFEPNLFAVLSYFENEAFASFLAQTLYEAQLARLSARIAVLSQTEDNLKKSLRLAFLQKEKERHRQNNRKQLEMLAYLPLCR
ncbi:hypothetical protein FJZ40_00555 [Candidatus Shapirobacteria bacterium]|nr:hypothetical protein [Candidatus Shapirobacteria bacterium]